MYIYIHTHTKSGRDSLRSLNHLQIFPKDLPYAMYSMAQECHLEWRTLLCYATNHACLPAWHKKSTRKAMVESTGVVCGWKSRRL